MYCYRCVLYIKVISHQRNANHEAINIKFERKILKRLSTFCKILPFKRTFHYKSSFDSYNLLYVLCNIYSSL